MSIQRGFRIGDFQKSISGNGKVARKVFSHFLLIATGEISKSIRHGSDLTGAPGQPVRTGRLLASWEERVDSSNQWIIFTKLFYAIYVEENVNGAEFRNHGPHSVKITVNALPRIVSWALQEAKKRVERPVA